MPTYQYRCRDCGEELEVVQSFTDKPKTKCPACKGSLRKVFAAPGISFKGSGFYKNDSRSGGKSGGSSSSTAGDSKAESKSEAKAESKSESTSSSTKKDAAKKDTKAAASSTT